MKKLFTILSLAFATIVNAQVTISPSTTAICAGNSVTFVANAAGYGNDTLNFVWLRNSVGFGAPNNDTISNAPSVGSWNYSVNVTTPGGQFIGTGFATLTVNANPTATASNNGPYCQSNGPIQLQASGGVSYGWSGPNGFSSNQQNPTISPVSNVNSGTYTVTVTNSNGCSATDNTTVTVNQAPIANAGSNSPVCQGSIIGLTANGGVSYAWTGPNGFASNVQNPILPNATLTMGGAYNVVVTDGNGCSTGTGFNVTVNPKPVVITTGTNASCNGANNGSALTLATVGSPFIHSWSTGATSQSISNLSPGIYADTVTNVYGCRSSDTATVGQPALLVANIQYSTNVTCFGLSNGTAGVSGTGGSGFFSFSWSDGGVGNPRNNLSAGTYTVTVTDANNCSDTAIVTITQPTALTANANGGGISCFGGNNGTAVVAVAGGTPGYSYTWTGGGSNDTITGLSDGTYIVTVTDANGCSDADTVTINEPLQVSFTYTQVNVLCNGNNTGSISATATGGVGSYQYRLNNGNWGTSNTFSGLAAGTYTVSVKDANGCTAGPTTIVLTQSNALQANANNTPQGCSYLGQAWASPSGGLGPYTFQWSNSLGTNDSIQAVAGTYTVTVTDANGCQSVDIAVIATPTPVSITGITTNPTCFGINNGSMNITVTGNAPFTYQWSNGATTQDITSLGSSNPYTVIATASNGCQGVWTDTLVLPTPLNISVNNDTTLCFGTNSGSLTSLATGGTGNYSFTWSPSGGNAGIANGLNAGVYTVIVTDANGCTATNQGQVFNAPALQINAVATPVQCAGNSNGEIDLTVTGGTPIYQYSWTGPSGFAQISGDITGLAAGNYNVTVTDANGCTATYTTTVLGSNNPIVVQWYAVQNPCQGTNNGGITVNASGGVSPYTFTWGDGFIGPIRTGLSAGTYTVMITDATGCEVGPFGQTLTANAGISITTPSVVDYCVGSGNLIPLTVTGGTQPYGYQWTDPNGTFFGTSQAIEPMVNGQYLGGIWTGVVTDGLGCSQTIYITVNITTCPTAIAEQSDDGFHVSVFPNPISSNGIVTIQWPSNIHEVITIDVKNITGQSVFHAKTNDDKYSINTSGLSSGTYMVQIASRDQLITKKLVVQ